MTLRHCTTLTLVTVALACTVQNASAQTNRPEVSGSGSVTISKQADTLRVNMDMLVAGKDLKEALALFKDRKEAAKAGLISLGASEKSIQIGDPEIKATQSDRQRQMEMMVRSRMKRGGKKKEVKEKPQPVSLVARLSAEWAIAGNGIEEVMINCAALQEKIKAADLGGVKEAEKKSAKDDEEASEEMEEMQMHFSNDGESKPGEPIFIYVRRLTEAEKEKAMADAFVRAKTNAAKLAKAAGASLGPINGISSHTSSRDQNYRYARQNYQWQQYMQANEDSENPDPVIEAVGPNAGKVTLQVNVTATFHLK